MATAETPFALTYRFEAKLPVEVLQPTRRVEEYEDDANEELLKIEKNFLEERREAARRRIVEYQRVIKKALILQCGLPGIERQVGKQTPRGWQYGEDLGGPIPSPRGCPTGNLQIGDH